MHIALDEGFVAHKVSESPLYLDGASVHSVVTAHFQPTPNLCLQSVASHYYQVSVATILFRLDGSALSAKLAWIMSLLANGTGRDALIFAKGGAYVSR